MNIELLEQYEFVKEVSSILLSVGEMIRSFHGERVEELKKKLGDGESLVTYIDREMNSYIAELMHKSFPDYGILAEEKKEGEPLGKKQYEGDGTRLLLIDPLDGTRDFINKTGEFVTSIGLIDRNFKRPVACIVLKPFGYDNERKMKRIEIVSAIKGKGAKLHAIYQNKIGEKTKIERVDMDLGVSGNKELNKCTVLKSRYHSNESIEKIIRELPVVKVLEIGSAGNKLISIAKGEADIYIHCGKGRSLYEWDVPAELAVEEAGGTVTTGKGFLLPYDQPDPTLNGGILATNGKGTIHSDLIKLVENCN